MAQSGGPPTNCCIDAVRRALPGVLIGHYSCTGGVPQHAGSKVEHVGPGGNFNIAGQS